MRIRCATLLLLLPHPQTHTLRTEQGMEEEGGEGRKTQNSPGTLFGDFSSVFNTIQLHVLARTLLIYFNLDVNIVRWIVDF